MSQGHHYGRTNQTKYSFNEDALLSCSHLAPASVTTGHLESHSHKRSDVECPGQGDSAHKPNIGKPHITKFDEYAAYSNALNNSHHTSSK